MAKKPRGNHWAYKEWASSINYYNKILSELYIQKINGRATELCLADTVTTFTTSVCRIRKQKSPVANGGSRYSQSSG